MSDLKQAFERDAQRLPEPSLWPEVLLRTQAEPLRLASDPAWKPPRIPQRLIAAAVAAAIVAAVAGFALWSRVDRSAPEPFSPGPCEGRLDPQGGFETGPRGLITVADATGSDNVWAMGSDGRGNTIVLRFDGVRWRDEVPPLPLFNYLSISTVSAIDTWLDRKSVV